VLAGCVMAVLIGAGLALRGPLAPALVAAALGGVLTFLVLREYDAQRRRRR
jgi:hypothetical protein